MTRILLERVTYEWVTGEPIFESFSHAFESGWTGVLGANGCGKSTLLQLLSGRLTPDEGRVVFTPSTGVAHLCTQVSEPPTASMWAFARSAQSADGQLRSILRLREESLERWSQLSPGERKRWQVGHALASNPAFLLLDEPTNHLDSEGKAWLLHALSSWGGVGVIVSHDREFLDALTTSTLMHDSGTSWMAFEGGFSVACEALEAHRAAQREELARADRRLKEARARERQLQVRAADVEKKRNTSARRRHVGDRDAGTMEAGIRIDRAMESSSRSAGVHRAKVERLAGERARLAAQVDYRAGFRFHWAPPPHAHLLSYRTEALWVGGRLLLSAVEVDISRRSRLALVGQNGAGKSSLLREFARVWRHGSERLTWLPQEVSVEEASALRERLSTGNSAEQGDFLALYARLGGDPARWRRGDVLSPGEVRKMLIADGLARQSWLLLLDEPTNHLDPDAVEALHAALSAWPGAMVLISHDERFLDGMALERWALREGRVVRI